MSIVKNQQSLYNFINTYLNNNGYGIEFRSDLFISDEIDYFDLSEQGNKEYFVPTMITDVFGEYLNVPDTNSFEASIGLNFDIFSGTLDNRDLSTRQYANALRTATLNAIEEFKSALNAKYFPLGTSYLMMGGEDSTIDVDWDGTKEVKQLYVKFTPYNTDEEDILVFGSGGHNYELVKNATHIRFEHSLGNFIEVPYTVNEENEVFVFHSGTNWYIIGNDTDTDSASEAYVANAMASLTIGGTTGFEGVLKVVAFDDETTTTFDFSDVDNEISDFYFILDTFDDKDAITNTGDLTLTDNTINNCILWSEDGNAIFGFGTLNPVSGLREVGNGALYQEYELPITAFISNDVLFGNNFEYYLDGIQVYPVGREHTLSADISGAQYISDNENEYLASESGREHTISFYYIPSKKLTSLLKHVVTGDTAQNTTYTLLVQYPFFQKSYEVIVDSGGTTPNINTLSTFTVVFKKADSNL